jgi:hypothetical protein
MAKYSLVVKNNSPHSGSFCVYTISPDTQEIQQDLRSRGLQNRQTLTVGLDSRGT